jgi:flagellar hook assembly protein FlgD
LTLSSFNPGSIRGGDNFEYQVDGIYASNSIISFSIKDNNISNTTLNLYNIKGQLVRKFIADDLTYGRYVINWNGTNKNGKKVSSGMYLLQIQRGNLNVVKKALLVK